MSGEKREGGSGNERESTRARERESESDMEVGECQQWVEVPGMGWLRLVGFLKL